MPVHLHLATADVMARVSLRRGAAIAPGVQALAQLVTEQPVAALNGDRFILRDPSASRTLGGGRVIDPLARDSRRASGARLAVLAALEQDTAEAALAALLDIRAGQSIAGTSRRFSISRPGARLCSTARPMRWSQAATSAWRSRARAPTRCAKASLPGSVNSIARSRRRPASTYRRCARNLRRGWARTRLRS